MANQTGQLVQLLTQYESPDADIYAVYPQQLKTSPRVKALVDFALAAFNTPNWQWGQDGGGVLAGE